ncbi:glycogen debranching protein [Flavivirga aquatica]|uniref:Glycogen debranching protein n=1 Tax=Flavivirga aquatica TaxID=1849968 RepID=A0A1E5T8U4_9FLAO|nr:amylo-alpha-1,6-glucosidase [Flavivirga aquatica]OEK07791.1 glycogen debranching protein [Flavivirga aquatica]
MSVHFGRETTGDLSIAEKKEWIITNGIGGYGSGSIAGSITRGYHGLMVASLHPPIDRKLMLTKLDEVLIYRNTAYDLTTNRWDSGSVSPKGYRNIESFTLERSIPCWRYACADAVFEKRLWMVHGKNTTYVSYTLVSAEEPVSLKVSALVNNRTFHNTGQVPWPIEVDSISDGVKITTHDNDALPLTIKMQGATVSPKNELYKNFYLPVEVTRGLNSNDTHVHAADFEVTIQQGQTVLFLGTAEEDTDFDLTAYDNKKQQETAILDQWQQLRKSQKKEQPNWVKQLVLAADQFVVNRSTEPNSTAGKSIIAGYHWFGDWGRDTMISLPGLTLSTGRHEDAGPILETFSHYINEGMLPNRFPNAADTPEYNTIDATLWFFQAIRTYFETTEDKELLGRLYPKLQEIIDWHIKGTRYGIQVDPNDNLLRGGQDGIQLTWMDAKVGDKVITPRIGKPIEVNALWYNALKAMVLFADILEKPSNQYKTMAASTKKGFERFWNEEKGYCFDVLDGPNGNEALLRPNQLFVVSLPESPLSTKQQKQIVDICSETLLTSHGLRSLANFEQEYIGIYTGNQYQRDSAYHQGTVWGWLIGPFIHAHLKIYKNTYSAQRFLKPFKDHLQGDGLGTISEIFDGDAPFTPKGCVAQAWSVGQILQVYDEIENLEIIQNTELTPKLAII